ncbi:unnamed protein product, partial [Mesorhabditis belari]|uniref:F-box domain-containing protein n=1 Tax=Mesorhabditis belari TaxID=2138241 RepID=A0AAF3FST8_9BILA
MKNLAYLKIPFTSKKIYFSPKAKAKLATQIPFKSPKIQTITELANQKKTQENDYGEFAKVESSRSIDSLNETLLTRIFSYLPTDDVDKLMMVNKKFHKIIRRKSFDLPKHYVKEVELTRSSGGLIRFRMVKRNMKTHHIYTNISGLRRYFARVNIETLIFYGKLCDVLLNVLSRVQINRFLAKEAGISVSYAGLSNFLSTSNVRYLNLSGCTFEDFHSICNQLFIENPQLECVKICSTHDRLSFPFLTDRVFFELSKMGTLPSQLILENVDTGISVRGVQILINHFRANHPHRPVSYLLGRIATNRIDSVAKLSSINDVTLFQIQRCKLGIHATFGADISIIFSTSLPRRRIDFETNLEKKMEELEIFV